MTSVTSRAQQYSQGKLHPKRWVFGWLPKTGSDCGDMMCCPFSLHSNHIQISSIYHHSYQHL